MSLPSVKPKQRDSSEYLKWLAYGTMGLYLIKLSQKQGKSLLGGEEIQFGKNKVKMNPDKLVDSISPWIDLAPEQKQMVVTAIKEFLKGLKNG